MEMNLLGTIVTIVFVMNCIVGVGNYLTEQYAVYLPHSSTYDNFTYMNYNTSEMDESIDYILDDPSLERSKPPLQTMWEVINGVPTFIDRTSRIAQVPTVISNLWVGAAYLIIYGIYTIFLVELFRPN